MFFIFSKEASQQIPSMLQFISFFLITLENLWHLFSEKLEIKPVLPHNSRKYVTYKDTWDKEARYGVRARGIRKVPDLANSSRNVGKIFFKKYLPGFLFFLLPLPYPWEQWFVDFDGDSHHLLQHFFPNWKKLMKNL